MTLRSLPLAGLTALALIACGGPSTSSTGPSPAPTPSAAAVAATATPANGIPVQLSDYMIMPGTLTARAGSITFDVKNGGPTVHNLTIIDSSGNVVGVTANLKAGESATLTVSLSSGADPAVCSLAGHEILGMKDVLTVS